MAQWLYRHFRSEYGWIYSYLYGVARGYSCVKSGMRTVCAGEFPPRARTEEGDVVICK